MLKIKLRFKLYTLKYHVYFQGKFQQTGRLNYNDTNLIVTSLTRERASNGRVTAACFIQ